MALVILLVASLGALFLSIVFFGAMLLADTYAMQRTINLQNLYITSLEIQLNIEDRLNEVARDTQ